MLQEHLIPHLFFRFITKTGFKMKFSTRSRAKFYKSLIVAIFQAKVMVNSFDLELKDQL
jgi:hypothetical protein